MVTAPEPEGEGLLYEQRGPIGILTLNRPERLNALNNPLVRALLRFFADRVSDYQTRLIILHGAGRAFCAGLDIKALATQEPWLPGLGPIQAAFANQTALADVVSRMRRCPQPLIAAVHGAAVGGGFALALACDLRIGTADTRFACSFLNLGVGGGDLGTSYHLPRLVGSGHAADLLYSGRMVDGKEAVAMGLLNRLVEPTDLLPTALAAAEEIAMRASPFGLRLTKEVLNETVTGISLDAALKLENRAQVLAAQTADSAEAIRAWSTRESPTWRDA